MNPEETFVPAPKAPRPDFLGLVPGTISAWKAVSGGANSRAWRIESSKGIFFLKEYYQGGEEERERDRGASERAFYSLALKRAAEQVPEPVAWDPANRAVVFRWVDGYKLQSSEISDDHLNQAFDFFTRLNGPFDPTAELLPEAAETAVSVAGHLRIVENRLRRLGELPGEVGDFVRGKVKVEWDKVKDYTDRHGTLSGPRCISPSDFGFHNALRLSNGTIKFFDFECAGWDDPAKMAADFVCQPQIPVPPETGKKLCMLLKQIFPKDKTAVKRFEVLKPVFKIKWVCIILNEFLVSKKKIKDFAGLTQLKESQKYKKLIEAKDYFFVKSL